jgi:hypothetical protein
VHGWLTFPTAWLSRRSRPLGLALFVALMALCITATAHAALAPTVTSKPSGLSAAPISDRSATEDPLRAPPVRAKARRLRAPARAQAQPSTHGPCTADTTLGSRRRARIWSPDLGAFLQPDEYGLITRGGTLWSWPGQNPFRWRDPSGRQAAEALAEGLELLEGLAPRVAANDVGATAGAETVAGGGATSVLAVPTLIGIGVGSIIYATWDIAHQIDDYYHPTVTHAARRLAPSRCSTACPAR